VCLIGAVLVCVKGSGGISSLLQDIAGAWLFQGPEGNIDDLYFGTVSRKIGNTSRLQRGMEGKVCGARSLREKKVVFV
jgi:hypothetical protein